MRRESFSGTENWKFEVGWDQLRSSIIAGLAGRVVEVNAGHDR